MNREKAQALIEVLEMIGEDAEENTIKVLPLYHKERLYYQNLIYAEGKYTLLPPNTNLDALKKGQCAWRALANIEAARLPEGGVDRAKDLEYKVGLLKAELADRNFYGLACIASEYKTLRFTPPLQGCTPKTLPDTPVVTADKHSATVCVRHINYNTDEGVSGALRYCIERILPVKREREAFMQWLSLVVYEDRTGKARPIFHAIGRVSTGKSLLMKIATSCVGSLTAKPLTTREDQRRWVFPDAQLLTAEESPEVAENSRKDFWNLCKSISKTLSPKEWDVKFKKAVAFTPGAYIIMATNDMPIAASEEDDIDIVIGITLNKTLTQKDFIMEDGTDAAKIIQGLDGLPKEFIQNDLWEAYKNRNKYARCGMDVYKSATYSSLEKTVASFLRNEALDQIKTYVSYIKFCIEQSAVPQRHHLERLFTAWRPNVSPTGEWAPSSDNSYPVLLREPGGIPCVYLKDKNKSSNTEKAYIERIFRSRGYSYSTAGKPTKLLYGVEFYLLPESFVKKVPVMTEEELFEMTGYNATWSKEKQEKMTRERKAEEEEEKRQKEERKLVKQEKDKHTKELEEAQIDLL